MSVETFGKLVKARRQELGLTQDELARRVGCAPVTVRKIEYDDLRPSVQIAERLAMALTIPLEERADFVRLARATRPPDPATPTPVPAPEEIGIEDLTGRAIRGYSLGERIGEGGMGVVYRAVQPLVEREVAVKIIRPQYANHVDFIRRFEAEAQLVARLEHPHIVPLYDYWREPSIAFLVMRLLRGGSLRHLLEEGPLPVDIALHYLEQVGSALGAAHRAGVIHRDLKPANILLDEDQNAYLADFGIAKNLTNPNLEDQTQVEAVIGSPAYISPEQIRSEFVRPQTDIYCLGVVLYELLTGQVPFQGPTPVEIMNQHLSAPLPPLSANRAGLPGTLDAVIQQATAKDPMQRYGDVESLLADLRAAAKGRKIGEAKTTTESLQVPLSDADNPYKGLRAFGEGDAQDFFGREALTQQLLVRMGEGGDLSRFLAVVGPSGSGKSSVVKAGLIPALRRGGLPGSENWFIVDLLPGTHPFEEIEAALLRIAVNPPESLLNQMRESPRGLLRAVRRSLPEDPNVELVLVMDQFEEVFTLMQNEMDRVHLLASLVAAVLDERSRMRVILTLRADFTDKPLNYVDFGELMRQRMEIVLPLTPDELESAITGPANRVGLKLEPGLVSAILRDVGDQPGTLPLLQYALTELFEQREDHTLTKQAYADIGGVLGALGRRAEEVFSSLDEPAQAAARQLFLRLVTLGEGIEDTRRRVLLTEVEGLKAEGWNIESANNQLSTFNRVLDAFGKARLLTFDHDPVTRGPTVEVAHEALLREWPRLREWLNESRGDVRLQRRLAQATDEWLANERETGFLLRGSRLDQFSEWQGGTVVALTQDEQAFLATSINAREQRRAEEVARQQRELETAQQLTQTERRRAEEQAAAANNLRRRAIYLGLALVVAVIFAVAAGIFSQQSAANADLAATGEAQALTNLELAQTRESEANTAANERATAQVNAEQQEQEARAQEATAVAAQAVAVSEREVAEQERNFSISRELASSALVLLENDPELATLLSLAALDVARTKEAVERLHQALALMRTERTLVGHEGVPVGVAFNHDGTMLASGATDNTVRVWDVATGDLLQIFDVYEDLTAGLSFDPADKRLATGSYDGSIRVWDLESGDEVQELVSETFTKWEEVEFSPDGRWLASSGYFQTILWDLETGEPELIFPDGKENVAFSPDGRLLVYPRAEDPSVMIIDVPKFDLVVWDLEENEELAVLRSPYRVSGGMSFSPDGKYLAVESDPVTVWNLDMDSPESFGQFVAELGSKRLGSPASKTEFLPDGQHVLFLGTDFKVKIWTIDNPNVVSSFLCTPQPNALAVNPAGTLVAATNNDGTIKLCWLDAPYEWQTVEDISPDYYSFYDVVFSPDGTRLYTAKVDGTLAVWDATTPGTYHLGEELLLMEAADKRRFDEIRFFNVEVSRDGNLLATASFDGNGYLWDAGTGSEILRVGQHENLVWSVAISPDGRYLATSSVDETVGVWDANTGEALYTLSDFSDMVPEVVFSPDGQLLVTGDFNGIIQGWELDTGERRFRLESFDGIWSITFSPDGQLMASSGNDAVVRIWDMAGMAEEGAPHLVHEMIGHNALTRGLSFSSDGTRLASASIDNTVRVWDVATGEELLALEVHTSQVWGTSFSPDGNLLATASWDGTARVLLLDVDELVELAESRLSRWFTEAECRKYLHTDTCPPPPWEE